MILYDAWIVITPEPWAAIAPAADAEPQSWHSAYSQAVTGVWRESVYNVLGTQADVAAIVSALGNPSCYAWIQGPGLDSLSPWPTDPAAVLALMKDHPDGSAPTFERPNWGNVFLGQGERVFAGAFSEGFGEGFL